MKIFSTLLLVLPLLISIETVSSQALYPVLLEEKVFNATHVVEGKVIQQHSFWNPAHTMIFTSNTVEVYKTFKGSLAASTVEIMTVGGSVGTESIEASDLLVLEKGTVGVFFCYPNSIHLKSPVTGNRLFNVYSSAQGFYNYDLVEKKASAPFVRYASIENGLYKELVKLTGRQPEVINPAFNVSSQSRPQKPLAHSITSFSPALVNAGAILDPATNLLTINGTGFSNTPGDSSAVIFDDANDGYGGTLFTVLYNSPLVQLWTDNQIQVRVPSRAGTGTFQVRDASMALAPSPSFLQVNYSVITRDIVSGGSTYIKEVHLMDDNGSGGYTVLYSSGTAGGGTDLTAAPERLTFERALNTWKEIAGFNVTLGGASPTQGVASDGENLILFDNANTGTVPLASGVLAVCYSYTNLCLPIATNEVQKTEFDILIRNTGVSEGSTSFTSGPCPPAINFAQTDLETVLLHELGHALNLAHINDSYIGTTLPNVDPGKLMNYAIVNGVTRKSPDYAAYTGALYCIQPQSNTYGTCSLSNVEMTPLTRTVTALDNCPVSFPSVSTPPGTLINFDLVHATSNKFVDPEYTNVNCLGTGTNVTNNAYYAFRSDADGGDLNILVGDYATLPADAVCSGAGARFALYQVNSCPQPEQFPAPVACRTIFRNGSLSVITGLAANTNYLIYVDGISNTKLSFTLTLNGSVLPVTLVDFNGGYANSKVNLSWNTSSEINSKEFQVEKSFDGSAFVGFAVVKAKGNSTIASSYETSDNKPYPDFTFYRLKMIDNDGQYKYSGIVKIKTPSNPLFVSRVYPNPAKEKITVELFANSRKPLTLEIYDLVGKKLQSNSIVTDPGVNQKQLNVNRLAGGTYLLQVKDAAGSILEKSTFIKN